MDLVLFQCWGGAVDKTKSRAHGTYIQPGVKNKQINVWSVAVNAGSCNKDKEIVIELSRCWERADILGRVVREDLSNEVSREMNE